MPSGRYGGATGSLPANNRNTSTAYASLSATGTAAGTMSAPRGASPPPAYPSAYPSAASGSTLSGSLGPFSLPSVPVYPSSMTGSRPLPPLRPLEALARRGRPRWGLRFFMLLIVAGVAAYFLRPYIPWIDSRIRPVEEAVRGFAQQTGLDHHLARLFANVNRPAPGPAPAITAPPAPPPAPVAVERAPAPAAKPAAAAAKSAVPGARPDIEPLSPRASRGAGAAPAAPGRAAPAAASRRAGVRSAALGQRRATREVASPRLRGLAARQRSAAVRRRMAFAASARRLREEPMPADDEITSAAPSAGVAAAAARPAPAPAAAAPEEAPAPAAKPAPEPPPAVEKGPAPRTTATLVKEAASSGDELDRLMAGAVSEKPAAPARRVGDRAIAEIDRKLAAVDKGGAAPAGAGRLKPAAATSAPPLSTGDIKTVMSGVQKQMNTCYRQHGKMGQADVKVDVAPDGSVAGTLIRGELAGTPTGACVESKIKAASFPASSGLRFDYRLSVR